MAQDEGTVHILAATFGRRLVRFEGPGQGDRGGGLVIEPSLVLAFTAGVASFASPCVLPLMPAFVAQLAGTSLGRAPYPARRHLLPGAFLFVGGSSIVIVALHLALSMTESRRWSTE